MVCSMCIFILYLGLNLTVADSQRAAIYHNTTLEVMPHVDCTKIIRMHEIFGYEDAPKVPGPFRSLSSTSH